MEKLFPLWSVLTNQFGISKTEEDVVERKVKSSSFIRFLSPSLQPLKLPCLSILSKLSETDLNIFFAQTDFRYNLAPVQEEEKDEGGRRRNGRQTGEGEERGETMRRRI